MIKNMSLMVTFRCNSKCKMCDIWKTKYKKADMDRILLEKISKSTVLKESKKYYGNEFDITFTGGEPFIREDFNEIFSFVNSYFNNSAYTISTNGIMTGKILGFMKENTDKKITLHVSVDGTKEAHDKQRGAEGSYLKTMKTIRKLRKVFPGLKIKLKFTITPENYREILEVYHLAKTYGTEFGVKPVENAKNYTNLGNEGEIRFKFDGKQIHVINNQLKRITADYKKRGETHNALFIFDVMKFMEKGKPFLESCNSPKHSVFIMPEGDVFNCLHFDPIGNLYEKSFDSIWNSERAAKAISIASKMECLGCASFHGSYSNYLNMFNYKD